MSPAARIRVLVADDHARTRRGICDALLADPGIEICGEAADASTAAALASRLRPDVCLLDVRMPGDGIVAARAIVDAVPEAVVVMLTVFASDDDLLGALRAGAAGYLLKDIDPDRLPHTVRGVLAGEAAVPRRLVARLVDEIRDRDRRLQGRRRSVELSDREWEVLELLDEGLETVAVSRRLGLSPITVRRHVARAVSKLEVPDRDAAVRLLREGR